MIETPWFEDFSVGDDFSDVPSVTITDGHAAIHQASFADRLRLPLDHNLSRSVTGSENALINPSLVCNFAIGQTTIPSQRVMGNLFYRGLVFQQSVFLGDTLSTSTKVVALKQNKKREGRAASGLVALEMHVRNQRDETVLLFWRCPMIPCRDPDATTGHDDSFALMAEDISYDQLSASIIDWDLETFRSKVSGAHFSNLKLDEKRVVESQDTVTMAPEMVRMTLNLAMTHTDATRSVYGKRLVYGGHTISMAAAQLTRVLPNMLTILGWFKCDHVSPVFEGDILRTEVTITGLHKLNDGGIARLHVETFATRGSESPTEGENIKVLDWHMAGLFG